MIAGPQYGTYVVRMEKRKEEEQKNLGLHGCITKKEGEASFRVPALVNWTHHDTTHQVLNYCCLV